MPELQRIAVLPREPEANTVMRTMERRIVEKPVDRGVTSQLTEAGYLHRDLRIRSNLSHSDPRVPRGRTGVCSQTMYL